MIRFPKHPVVFLLLTAAFSTRAAAPAPSAPAVEPTVPGASLVEECTSCHTLERGGKEKWGPNLFGIVGRPVGAEADYRYGAYLRAQSAAGATWDEASLREWLVASKDIAKAAGARTKMPMQQLTDDQLDDLIRYLRTLK